MFAILPKNMESSPVCRPSSKISPLACATSPPPLISLSSDVMSVDPSGAEYRKEISEEKKDEESATKLQPHLYVGSRIFEPNPEMHFKNVVRKNHQQIADGGLQTTSYDFENMQIGRSEYQNGTHNGHDLMFKTATGPVEAIVSSASRDVSNWGSNTLGSENLQEAFLAQRAVATMLSWQRLQQHSAAINDLRHPTPVNCGSNTSSTPSPQPIDRTVMEKKPVSSASIFTCPAFNSVPAASHSLSFQAPAYTCDELNADLPLDLSMPSAGKKRYQEISSQPRNDIGNNQRRVILGSDAGEVITTAKSANTLSRFPTFLTSLSNSKESRKQATTAEVEAGMPHGVSRATNEPRESLHRNQKKGVGTGEKTLNELLQGGVSPLQIQQWFLAAVSAQKWQQMALSSMSLLQQQKGEAVSNEDPPRKRQKIENGQRTDVSSSLPRPPRAVFPPFLSSPSLSNYPTPSSRPDNSSSAKCRSPTVSSPAVSPDSSQSLSGKRYRRYAKPPYSYVSLIMLSILSSRAKKLRLSQLLKRISDMFPFFDGTYQGWRDSVRHNLSQNECFVKVLKNPSRPTAKGNFWTVNLNSIPHELLLRQNTLVSRYAQDSGFRYRKDLSEVFDLRTGVLKVPLPRHLLKDTSAPLTSPLSNDPAAVMEAILLEKANDDEMNDYKDKITPDVRQFTLEDLFSQNEEGEDGSLSSRRSRGKALSRNATVSHPSLLPRPFLSPLYQRANMPSSTGSGMNVQAGVLEVQNLPVLPQILLPQTTQPAAQLPIPLQGAVVNPFTAAQTALLRNVLAATSFQQGQDSFLTTQATLHADPAHHDSIRAATSVSNVADAKAYFSALSQKDRANKSRPTSSPTVLAQKMEDRQKIMVFDVFSTPKRKKRKGAQPIRYTETQNGPDEGTGNLSRATPDFRCQNVSSEVDSTCKSHFSSPAVSSTFKSISSVSPGREDESFETGKDCFHSRAILNAGSAPAMSAFQALQMFGNQPLQANRTM